MNSPDLFKHRVGKFLIQLEILDRFPGLVQEILSTVIVVRAEVLYDRDAIEYTGLSHSFDVISASMRAPWYSIQVTDGRFQKWVKE